jgi:hypothetical protein
MSIVSSIPDLSLNALYDPAHPSLNICSRDELLNKRTPQLPAMTPLAFVQAIKAHLDFGTIPPDAQFMNLFLFDKTVALDPGPRKDELRLAIRRMGGRVAKRGERSDFVIGEAARDGAEITRPAWLDALFQAHQWVDPSEFRVRRSASPRIMDSQLQLVRADGGTPFQFGRPLATRLTTPKPIVEEVESDESESERDSDVEVLDMAPQSRPSVPLFPSPGRRLRKLFEGEIPLDDHLSSDEIPAPEENRSPPSQRLISICDQLMKVRVPPLEVPSRSVVSLSQLSAFSQVEESQGEQPVFDIAYERDVIELPCREGDEGDPLLASSEES